MPADRLRNLQLVGYAEGTSYLLLLGIAMPLKYAANWPYAVQVVGAAHGGLWIVYLLAAAWAGMDNRWGVGKYAGAFVASILPAGPFVFDAWVNRERRALAVQSGDVQPPAAS